MATYIYYCSKCKDYFDEMWRSPEDYIWPCPVCGTGSKRAPYSGVPAIRGETVGSSFSSSRAVDPKGRYRMTDFQEASEEVADGHDRVEQREGQAVNRPNLYHKGLNRAKGMGAQIHK